VSEVAARLAALRDRVARAAARVGREPEEITLVGVSKRQPLERVRAALRAGLRDIGESYVQEAVARHGELVASGQPPATPPRWHFVGRLQRNKVRQLVPIFDVVQTLDRESLGDELERRCARAGRQLEVLVQVDLCDEPQKGGVAPERLPGLLAAGQRWPSLRITGLMAIPAAARHAEESRAAFARLRELRDAQREQPGGAGLRELSMGMSQDFEVAIEEGATIIRLGTALFGERAPG
jgi:pyridoxal phosphate enzyme (YggS family)